MAKTSKAVKAGIGYTIGNYLVKGLAFLTIPIFSRLLTVDDFGLYNIYVAYESILYVIIGFSVHACVKNAKYDYKEKFDEFVSSIVLLSVISMVVWIIAAFVLFTFRSEVLGMNRLITVMLIFNSFGSSILLIYNTYIGLYYEYKSYLLLSVANSVLNISFSLVFILFVLKNDGYTARVLGTAIPGFLIGLYIVFLFFSKAKPKVNFSYWKYALLYSIPIIPHGISQVILNTFDRIMIKSMVDETAAGLYSFSYTSYTLVFVTAVSLEKVWSPWMYEQLNAKKFDNIRHRQKDFVIGMSLFVSLIVLLAPEMILILGGAKYSESIYTVIPLVLSGYFVFLYSLPVCVEYYCAKTKMIGLGTTVAAVINIILNFIFIKAFGYTSAAYTTLFTYILYFLFHLFLAKKAYGKNVYSSKPFVIGIVICSLFSAVSFLLIKNMPIRIILFVLLLILSAVWAVKNFNILSKIKAK